MTGGFQSEKHLSLPYASAVSFIAVNRRTEKDECSAAIVPRASVRNPIARLTK